MQDQRTVPVGSVTIDLVDADRKQLIWESFVAGRLTPADLRDPRARVHEVVAELLTDVPAALEQSA